MLSRTYLSVCAFAGVCHKDSLKRYKMSGMKFGRMNDDSPKMNNLAFRAPSRAPLRSDQMSLY